MACTSVEVPPKCLPDGSDPPLRVDAVDINLANVKSHRVGCDSDGAGGSPGCLAIDNALIDHQRQNQGVLGTYLDLEDTPPASPLEYVTQHLTVVVCVVIKNRGPCNVELSRRTGTGATKVQLTEVCTSRRAIRRSSDMESHTIIFTAALHFHN